MSEDSCREEEAVGKFQLCPLRKRRVAADAEFRAWREDKGIPVTYPPLEWVEHFMECLGPRCGVWDAEWKRCGFANLITLGEWAASHT